MDGKKILVVDDDKDFLRALRVRLASRGYVTLSATDAASAIETALKEKPNLAILDLGLPDNNGFAVMEMLKSWHANIPVIVVSGRPFAVYKDASLMAGAKAYLQKPFDNEDLFSAIEKELAA